MRKNVQILICDRCGKSVMLKEKSIYESRPDGWMSVVRNEQNLYERSEMFKELCPDCAKSYNDIIESFWEPKKIEASDET